MFKDIYELCSFDVKQQMDPGEMLSVPRKSLSKCSGQVKYDQRKLCSERDNFAQRHNKLHWCARKLIAPRREGAAHSLSRVQTGLTCKRRRASARRQSGRSILCARAFCCLHFVSPSSRAILYFILRPGQTTRGSPVITVTSNKKG